MLVMQAHVNKPRISFTKAVIKRSTNVLIQAQQIEREREREEGKETGNNREK